ncbi:MAG: PQQ-binding-like beta-propeller repeat protein [Planctomycetia bacterium]|nr:PQQ-binding-like beta-propeller repeat protein [Planctomycetia bacterium]
MSDDRKRTAVKRIALRCTVVALTWLAGLQAQAQSQAPSPGTIAGFPKLSAANDWPWWRGPTRDGHTSPNCRPPTKWSETENVVWKVPVPGRGHSSPTVAGNFVFLTTADEAKQIQAVVAFDRTTGRQLWKSEISQGGFPNTHTKNTHATPSVACDGDLLFVTFHHHDTLQTLALDLAGKIVWNESLGEFHPKRYEYGYAPSPVLYRNTVIIAAEYDGDSSLMALNRQTGSRVWRAPRPNNMSFSTPSINVVGKRELLTITGAGKLSCFDPATGRPLWDVEGTTDATCGTTVSDGDIIFASGGYPKAETIAVRAQGSGEVLWKNKLQCYEQSMLAYQGYLYQLTDNGVLYCFRGTDGQEMWHERLRGPVSASPIVAAGHVYWANERGTHYVFRTNPERLEMVAENILGDESMASPAVCGDRLFLRVASGAGAERQEYLYCIGRP